MSLHAQSSFATVPRNRDVHPLLDPLIQDKGEQEAFERGVPHHLRKTKDAPLLIQGDKDEYIPFAEDTNLQTALRNAGVRCDIIRTPGGAHGTGKWHALPDVPEWERQTIEWLNARLHSHWARWRWHSCTGRPAELKATV